MATAKTKEQWYEILKTWVPSWFFETELNQSAHFYALAKMLNQVEQDAIDHITETFILQASGRYLDEHGADRNKTRSSGESDADFAPRVQQITNLSNKPAIQAVATDLNDSLAYVQEWFDEGMFCDADFYVNIGQLFKDELYNHFWVFIDLDSNGSATFEEIFDRINAIRAAGVHWILVEREDFA